ncbi:MoaD/ThiS family protein [Amycolatopsis jejuensis]|uniref:MoaD/ThiS family protein n=1 Tax=Amycolatopsis jejuensis TaxID=330084 RepID=UPI0005240D4D|nr:MoaD/ThiS family protein [Amycolatopsis jejuensis]
MTTEVRVKLPTHLRRLAKVEGEVLLPIEDPPTQRSLLDALERTYPMLRGTIRDTTTGKRRAFVRFFACEDDLSNTEPDTELPRQVLEGTEPFLIIGAMAGG